MAEVWQLASIAHEVRMLCEAGVVINFTGIGGGSVLMKNEAFDKMFPIGWTEKDTADGSAVIRSFNYDGISFECVRYPNGLGR